MQDSVGLVEWNPPSSQTMVALAVAFGVLLAAALLIEAFRQRRQRRMRVAAAWQAVEAIEAEKGLSQAERNALATLIRRWAPDEPLRVATTRLHFDTCVEKEMESLRQQGDHETFENMGTLLRDIRSRLALDFVPLGQRIHSTRELYQGQEVWFAGESGNPPQWIRGSVAVSNEAVFHVAPREFLDRGRPAFRPHDPFRFRLYRDEDARYAFATGFIRSESEPPNLVFLHTSKLNRIQSREHYRVRHEQATNVGVMNAPLDTSDPTTRDRRIVTRLRGQITNVSAGGFAVVLPQAVPAQVLIRVTLDLEFEAAEPFEVDARIVGTTPLPGGRCLVRAAYYETETDKREIIARYVVHRQQRHEPSGTTE